MVICYTMAVIMLVIGIAGFSEAFRQNYFRLFMAGWFVLGIADVVYIGKSKRFVHAHSKVWFNTPPHCGGSYASKKRK